MEYRHLGRSGLKISEIAYGNWITHGSQVEEDAARACVGAALDEGITTFDTADVYAGTQAEEVLGRALRGVRRESVEIFTKVYWPTGPGPNDRGLSRKHIMESAHASLRRLQTDYVDLYQAHRYDHETPLEETLRAFDDLVRQGKVLYIGVSEWRAEEIAAALRIAGRDGPRPDHLQPAAVQHDLAGHRGRGRPAVREGGDRPDRLVADRPGRAHRQVPARRRAAGRVAGDRPERVRPSSSGYLTDDILRRVQQLRPVADEAGLTLAQLAVAWVLQNPNVSAAIVGATRPGAGAGERARPPGSGSTRS